MKKIKNFTEKLEEKKELIYNLYYESEPKLSGKDIADHLGVSVKVLFHHMEKWHFSRRNSSEAIKNAWNSKKKEEKIIGEYQ